MARADLAIGAGGSTTWERACLRLPSLVVAIAENQLPFSKALDQAGYLQLLGYGPSVTVKQIRSALLSLIANPMVMEPANALMMAGGHHASRWRCWATGGDQPATSHCCG